MGRQCKGTGYDKYGGISYHVGPGVFVWYESGMVSWGYVLCVATEHMLDVYLAGRFLQQYVEKPHKTGSNRKFLGNRSNGGDTGFYAGKWCLVWGADVDWKCLSVCGIF